MTEEIKTLLNNIKKSIIVGLMIFSVIFVVFLGVGLYQYDILCQELVQINETILKENTALTEKIETLDTEIDELKLATEHLENENEQLKAELAQ